MTEDGKFAVPEPDTGIESGFLTDYWQSQVPLPTLTGYKVWVYYFNEAIRSLWAMPVSTVITIITITISIFLFGGFLLLLKNIDTMIASAGDQLTVSIYLNDQVDDKQITEFVEDLESRSDLRSVGFTSKDEALEKFKQELGKHKALLAGLEDNNPLPASIDLVFYKPEIGISTVSDFVKKLRENDLVDEVVYGSEWVRRAQGVLGVFRGFGLVSSLIVLGVIMFLIANTIKLVMFARREELGIMRLVGAAEGFVKTPLVLSGGVQGLIGASLGIVMLKLAFVVIELKLQATTVFGVAISRLEFLTMPTVVLIVLIGMFVGSVGSFITVGKFMKV